MRAAASSSSRLASASSASRSKLVRYSSRDDRPVEADGGQQAEQPVVIHRPLAGRQAVPAIVVIADMHMGEGGAHGGHDLLRRWPQRRHCLRSKTKASLRPQLPTHGGDIRVIGGAEAHHVFLGQRHAVGAPPDR